MERGHVLLFAYDYKTKAHERYDALVIGEREGKTKPILDVVYFRHLEEAAHHALAGVNWASAFERTLDIPHKEDLGNEAFYWIDAEEEGKPSADDLDHVAEEIHVAEVTSGHDTEKPSKSRVRLVKGSKATA